LESESSLLRLALLAYEAAAEPAIWPRFLELYSNAISSDTVFLQVHDFGLNRSKMLYTFGVSSGLKPSYDEHYSKLNVWRQRGRALYLPGKVNLGSELCPRSVFERSDFYNDYLLRVRLAYTMGAVIGLDRQHATMLTGLRGERKGGFGEDERKVAKFLLPYLSSAWTIHQRSDLLAAGESVMDTLPYGVVFLAMGGTAIYCNRTAEEIFRANDGLSMRDGVLSAIDPNRNAQLRKEIDAALSPRRTTAGPPVSVPRMALRREYQVVASPLRRRFQQFAATPMPLAVVLITDPERKKPTCTQLLIQIHGLTPKEAALAAKLSEGKPVKQAAEELSIRYETARTHLRSIFSKTGTSRQAELLLLIHRLPVADASPDG
jgi:DNA-binding CsgD family transcriptional regulator